MTSLDTIARAELPSWTDAQYGISYRDRPSYVKARLSRRAAHEAAAAAKARDAASTEWATVVRVAMDAFPRSSMGCDDAAAEAWRRRRWAFCVKRLNLAGWILVDASGAEVAKNGHWIRRAS